MSAAPRIRNPAKLFSTFDLQVPKAQSNGSSSASSSSNIEKEESVHTVVLRSEASAKTSDSPQDLPNLPTPTVQLLSAPLPIYPYMYDKLKDREDAFDREMEHLVQGICKEHGLEGLEMESLHLRRESSFWTYGRVYCEVEGRLNESSAVLQRGDHRIRLDFRRCPHLALFSGQVIVVKGNNPTGAKIICESIYSSALLPNLSVEERGEKGSVRPLSLLVACGPFVPVSASDSQFLQFERLQRLLQHVTTERRPSAILLLGPFVDATHPLVDECELSLGFDLAFERFCHELDNTLDALQLKTQIIMVPSVRDVQHDLVFPQFPFRQNKPTSSSQPYLSTLFPKSRFDTDATNVHWLSNPCTVCINGVVLGITSADILADINEHELCRGEVDTTIPRLAGYILQQHSYYPMLPTALHIPLDSSHVEWLRMPCTPDLLILPSSRLAPYVEEVTQRPNNSNDDKQEVVACCINPGHVSDGISGTYALVEVRPPSHLQQQQENDSNMELEVKAEEGQASKRPFPMAKHVTVDVIRF
ncbi:DNA polymerase alpha subunit B [Balamuthia mandrillaris]